MSPSIGLVGSGPAATAIDAAAADLDAEVTRVDPTELDGLDLVAVVAAAGDAAFARVNRTRDDAWIAIELGGIGGYAIPDVDAAVSVLGADAGCFDCLRRRVESNHDGSVDEAPSVSRPDARLAGAVAGRSLASILDGSSAPGRVIELPYIERRLYPVPGCSCGSAIDPGFDRSADEPSLEATMDRADRAIDDRIGLVDSIGEVHSFPVPYYLAELCDTSVFSDVETERRAAGVAVDWNRAFVKAVGEALERYAAGVYRESRFETAAAANLDDAVDPARFVLPDEGYRDPDPHEPIPWVPGEDLSTRRSVRLPAEFACFPPSERRHKPPITTGLGLRGSTVGALLSGLYEVIERDATMLAWYSTFEPLGLSVDDPEFRTLERRARSEDLSVTPLLVTQDIDVPVVTVCVHRDGEWPAFAVGSSANLDAGIAARGALEEALQNWTELRDLGPDAAAEESGAIGRYASFPREARSLVEVEDRVSVASVGPDDPPDGAAELDAVLDRVIDAGLDAYAARLTTRDVAAVGFEVVRVLVPAAQPLFTGDRYFGERARRVPRDLGFRPRLDRPHHPYP